jgi:hypothetical protein
LEFAQKHRSLVAFVCGVGSVFLLMGFGSLAGELSAVTALVVGSGTFLLAGVVGCLLFPHQPFRAASIVVLGVFAGIILHIVLFPKLNGFERNLFPLEIVANTFWAAICCFLFAALWKVGLRSRLSEKSGA